MPEDNPETDARTQQRTDYQSLLEAIDTHATELLEAITNDESLTRERQRRAVRHCREVRAECECLSQCVPVRNDERE